MTDQRLNVRHATRASTMMIFTCRCLFTCHWIIYNVFIPRLFPLTRPTTTTLTKSSADRNFASSIKQQESTMSRRSDFQTVRPLTSAKNGGMNLDILFVRSKASGTLYIEKRIAKKYCDTSLHYACSAPCSSAKTTVTS